MDFGLDHKSAQREPVTFKEMGLPKELLPNVHYPIATPIQRKVIPKLLQGEDLVAISRTGSGKTFAYVIPILMQLLKKREKKSIYTKNKALIIVPTYELAVQVSSVFIHLSSGGVHPALFTGIGSLAHTFNYLVVGHFEVAICTPGRLEHLLEELAATDKARPIYLKAPEDGTTKEVAICTAQLLEKIASPDIVVIDEMDRILEDKSLSLSLARVLEHIKGTPQYALFSATHHRGSVNVRALLGRPEMEIIEILGGISEHLEQDRLKICNFFVQEEVKLSLLVSLCKKYREERVLVFISTCRRAAFIASAIRKMNISVGVLSSLEAEESRSLSVKEFRTGSISVLISTDVGCRGLDIKGISAVIEYDYAADRTTAVHRIGRMNRGRSESGRLFSFIRVQDLPCYFSFLNHIYSEVPRDSKRETRICFQTERCIFGDKHVRCCYLGLGRVPLSFTSASAEFAASIEIDPFFSVSYEKYIKTNKSEKIDKRWVVSSVDKERISIHPFFGSTTTSTEVEEALRAYRPRKGNIVNKTNTTASIVNRKTNTKNASAKEKIDLEQFKDPSFIPYEGGRRVYTGRDIALVAEKEAKIKRERKLKKQPGEAFAEWKNESRSRLAQGYLLQRPTEKKDKEGCKKAEGAPHSVKKVMATRQKREKAFQEKREKRLQKRKRREE